MTLLAVFAHPDDETFGCGSVLLHAARRTRTVVVCATLGEAGHPSDRVTVPPEGLGSLRERELHEAAAVLGVDQVETLGLLDSGMDGDPSPGTLCATPLEQLTARVRDAVDRHRPSVVLTLDGSDGHRDHVRVRDAVLAAVEPDTALYLHCLPRSLAHAWLLERAGAAAAAEYAAMPQFGTPDEEVTTMLDTAWCYQTRWKAIQTHRSQDSPFDEISEDLRRRALTTEHLRRVQPRWTGGRPEHDLVGLPG